MPFDVKAAVKKPWVKYGLIAIAFIGVFLIIKARESGSGATTNANGESDAQYQADAALAQSQLQASTAAAMQDSSQNFQLARQSEADKTNLSALSSNIAGQLALADKTNAANVSLANIQLSGLQAQLDEAAHVSDNQTAAYINNTDQSASAVKNASNNQFKTGLVSTAAALAIAFF